MRKRLYFSIIALMGVIGLQTMIAGTPLKYDDKLVTGKLENGLTYYIYPNDNPKGEAVYRLFIKAGSVYETERQKVWLIFWSIWLSTAVKISLPTVW